MAGWNALTGARGIVAAFVMSILLQLGLVDVTTALLACAAISAIGVALFVRAGRSVGASATSPAFRQPGVPLPQAVGAAPVART